MRSQSGPLCLATRTSTKGNVILSGQSEDCLFLDVYAPTNATTTSMHPVFFYMQGGGFNQNPGNYNASSLIEGSGKNIVVVQPNYRVGPYGFLASQEVQANGSLNNGLKDQRQALRWVQSHIAMVALLFIRLHKPANFFPSLAETLVTSSLAVVARALLPSPFNYRLTAAKTKVSFTPQRPNPRCWRISVPIRQPRAPYRMLREGRHTCLPPLPQDQRFAKAERQRPVSWRAYKSLVPL